jgi:hypothetical protein
MIAKIATNFRQLGSQGPGVFPLLLGGTGMAAIRTQLFPEELARIEAAIPASSVAATRYSEQQTGMLDREG